MKMLFHEKSCKILLYVVKMNHTRRSGGSPTAVRSKSPFGLLSAFRLLMLLAAGSNLLAAEASAPKIYAGLSDSIDDPYGEDSVAAALLTGALSSCLKALPLQ